MRKSTPRFITNVIVIVDFYHDVCLAMGDGMTGYAYDLIGKAVDHRHNLSLPISLLSSNNTDVNGMIPHSTPFVMSTMESA